MTRLVRFVCVVFALLVPSVAGAGEWKALFGKIVFANPETGETRSALFVRESNGSVHQLTNPTNKDESVGSAAWSWDGTEIAYSTGGVLRIMSADGSNQRVVDVGNVPWGPGGLKLTQTHIVFSGTKGNRGIIWAAPRLDTKNLVKIAEGDDAEVSFDGKLVAFNNGDSFLVGIDGVGQRFLSDGRYPKFLPDGRIVVLRDELRPEMWVIDPTIGDEKFLAYGRDFSVSSDGWVVYDYSDPVRGWYAIRPDGTGKQLIESEWRTRRGFQVFGDLLPDARFVPTGKLSTTWGELKK